MSPRDLLFRVLLISIVRFSTTSIIRPQGLFIMRLSSESAKGLEPERWKIVYPNFMAPQIEIQLTKGHVSPDENWMFINNHSIKDHQGATKMTLMTDEEKIPQIENMESGEKEREEDMQDNIVMPDRLIPPIGSRNIITVPTFCPQGEKKDSLGKCKPVLT